MAGKACFKAFSAVGLVVPLGSSSLASPSSMRHLVLAFHVTERFSLIVPYTLTSKWRSFLASKEGRTPAKMIEGR